MELPITDNDLDTIVKALSLGGDTRLYFLLKNFKEDRQVEFKTEQPIEDSTVKIYSESDDYKCKHGECDI
tara:strand:- start:634 stop:843 length:210 start_codon:yes stop_codon:yes gene_type:complete